MGAAMRNAQRNTVVAVVAHKSRTLAHKMPYRRDFAVASTVAAVLRACVRFVRARQHTAADARQRPCLRSVLTRALALNTPDLRTLRPGCARPKIMVGFAATHVLHLRRAAVVVAVVGFCGVCCARQAETGAVRNCARPVPNIHRPSARRQTDRHNIHVCVCVCLCICRTPSQTRRHPPQHAVVVKQKK